MSELDEIVCRAVGTFAIHPEAIEPDSDVVKNTKTDIKRMLIEFCEDAKESGLPLTYVRTKIEQL